jgi:hypothetical protein
MERYHIRHYFDPEYPMDGGYTSVTDRDSMIIGIAVCSDKDQFCRKTGVAVAKERIHSFIQASEEADTIYQAQASIVAPHISGVSRDYVNMAINSSVRYLLDYYPKTPLIQIVFDIREEEW